jgi:negative regulator of flagellin synthesis FlgM
MEVAMNINKLYPSNKVINLYNQNKTPQNKNEELNKGVDKIEISSLGRKLSSLQIDDIKIDNKDKIEKIRKQIKDGTYKVDTEKLSKSMIDNIKGDKV